MILRNRSFVLLMTGEIIGGIGLWFSIIANLMFMSKLLSSDFMKSLLLMIGVFASVIFLPQIGKIVDRYNKRNILIVANILRCVAPLLMLPALYYGSIPWMLASLVMLQISGAVYFPAVRTAIPMLVERENLLAANTFHMNAITISRIAGTAIAGVLVEVLDLYTIYISSLVVYAVIALLFLLVRIPEASEAVVSAAANAKMKFSEVFRVIRQERSVLIGIIATGVINLFLGGINLIVLSISELMDTPKMMGYMYAVEGMSILVAGLFVKRLIGGSNLVKSIASLLFLFALAQFTMSFVNQWAAVLGGMMMFGFLIAFLFPMAATLFQQRVAKEMHGRFFSFKEMVDRIIIQVALLATGASLDLFGTSVYLIAIAGFTALTGLFAIVLTIRFKLDVRQAGTRQIGG